MRRHNPQIDGDGGRRRQVDTIGRAAARPHVRKTAEALREIIIYYICSDFLYITHVRSRDWNGRTRTQPEWIETKPTFCHEPNRTLTLPYRTIRGRRFTA